MDFLKKLHFAGIMSGLTTTIGVLGSAGVITQLPRPVAIGVAILGVILQGSTRAVNKGDVVEVKKPPTP